MALYRLRKCVGALMPTRDGQKSIKDAIDNGMPFVDASGIKTQIRHADECRARWGVSACRCGVHSAIRVLAMEYDRILEQHGGTA